MRMYMSSMYFYSIAQHTIILFYHSILHHTCVCVHKVYKGKWIR